MSLRVCSTLHYVLPVRSASCVQRKCDLSASCSCPPPCLLLPAPQWAVNASGTVSHNELFSKLLLIMVFYHNNRKVTHTDLTCCLQQTKITFSVIHHKLPIKNRCQSCSKEYDRIWSPYQFSPCSEHNLQSLYLKKKKIRKL